jgi:glutamate--cysteine ligase
LEAEKFGIRSDGTPLRYNDPRGVPALFDELTKRFGWVPESEVPGGPILALMRDGASITLEPGSQFELSGAPHDDVHAIVAEVELHKRELASLESARDIHWLGLGFHPFAHPHDLDWVPKLRYPIMREYLPTRGRYPLDMMRRTATVQANFDFANEREAMTRLRVALGLSPLVQALFANSAVYEGVRHPIKSHRAEVWLDVDNSRAGLLPFAWKPDASLGDYVRWALAVPMFLVKRDGHVIRNTGQTFADFLRNGFAGQRATMTDWETHLNTLFPDVRLKRTLEVRSADSVPAGYSAALPAFWAGILYDADALGAAGEIVLQFGCDAWQATKELIPAHGLGARIGGHSLRDLALRVLDHASRGLSRRARKDAQGRDECMYLDPLIALAASGKCIGDDVLGDWRPDMANAREKLFERAKY